MPKPNNDFSTLVHSPVDLRDELLAFAEEAKYPGIPFGVPSIDRNVIPMRPGNFVALIGRPGSAKSSLMAFLARQEAQRIIARGKQLEEAVVYVTWESSAEELEAFFQADDKVSVTDIAWGRADLEYMRERAQSRANLPIWVIGHGIGRAGKKAPRMTLEAVLGGIRTMEDEYHVKPRLLLFDYIQLVPVPSAKERVEQVSEAPILIKELAGQLAVPAVAGVQARQEVDRTSSKIPGMDDGQWSCLAADAEIMSAQSGRVMSAEELYRTIKDGAWVRIHSLDESSLKIVPATAIAAKKNPVEQIYRIDCGADKVIRANVRHKFYTPNGWKEVSELRKGDWVAFAKKLSVAKPQNSISPELALALGLLLGDGVMVKTLTLTNSNREILDAFRDAVEAEWPELTTFERKQTAWDTFDSTIRRRDGRVFPGCNPALNWSRKIGLFGCKAKTKHIPDIPIDDDAARALLAGLFATDGSVYERKRSNGIVVVFCSISETLAKQTAQLLMRFGIVPSIKCIKERGHRNDLWQLWVPSTECKHLSELLDIPGSKGKLLREHFETHKVPKSRSMGDIFPNQWTRIAVKAIKKQHLRDTYNVNKTRGITRGMMKRIADGLGDNELLKLAESDIVWRKIKSITEDGMEHTYDFCVPDHENFVASEFITHNSSITQTADKAFALMRPIVAFPGTKRIKLDWLDGKEVEVTDTLLILRLLKQRMEKAGLTWALHFDPRYLVLAEKELRQQEDWA